VITVVTTNPARADRAIIIIQASMSDINYPSSLWRNEVASLILTEHTHIPLHWKFSCSSLSSTTLAALYASPSTTHRQFLSARFTHLSFSTTILKSEGLKPAPYDAPNLKGVFFLCALIGLIGSVQSFEAEIHPQ